MIEHSINKYEIPKPVSQSYATYHATGSITWGKEKYDDYISQMKLKGWLVGTPVISKYGIMGVLGEYKSCPDAGITFYNQTAPNAFTLIRAKLPSSDMGYNESELTIIPAITA